LEQTMASLQTFSAKASGFGLTLQRGSEVVVHEKEWLVDAFLPEGTLTLLAGEEGCEHKPCGSGSAPT
jgi:hypothetical protein